MVTSRKVKRNPAKPFISRAQIPVPDTFVGRYGDPWIFAKDNERQELDFLGVLFTTCFYTPVKTAEESDRQGEVCDEIFNAQQSEADVLELREADFDWMMRHFELTAHLLWRGPEAAYLRKYLRDNHKRGNLAAVDKATA